MKSHWYEETKQCGCQKEIVWHFSDAMQILSFALLVPLLSTLLFYENALEFGSDTVPVEGIKHLDVPCSFYTLNDADKFRVGNWTHRELGNCGHLKTFPNFSNRSTTAAILHTCQCFCKLTRTSKYRCTEERVHSQSFSRWKLGATSTLWTRKANFKIIS